MISYFCQLKLQLIPRQKLIAILEALSNSIMFFTNSIHWIIFENKRTDYRMIIKRLPTKRQLDKQKFEKMMNRIAK